MKHTFSLSTLVIALLSGPVFAADPVIDDPITGKVNALIPVGKALMLPVSALDGDGHPVTFTVSSNNARIMARARTGNPLLKMEVQHGTPGSQGSYAGTIVFQLFRDWTPETAAYIAGFAQGGYYDGLGFHRLADLHGSADPAIQSWIFQGGQRAGAPVFSFENEFRAPLLFSGRGQLAMANRGAFGRSDFSVGYEGTNGFEFFITDGGLSIGSDNVQKEGRPRHLDFKHNIFGQVTHGWELLPLFRTTPITGSTPNQPVTITSAEVVPRYRPSADSAATYTDAMLVLTATAPGNALITIRAVDSTGRAATRTVAVKAIVDTVNTRPFIQRIPAQLATPKETQLNFPVVAVDLEHDYLQYESELSNNSVSGTVRGFTDVFGTTGAVLGNTGYEGPLFPVLKVTEFDMTYRGDIDGLANGLSYVTFPQGFGQNMATGDNWTTTTISVGDMAITPQAVNIEAAPGVPLANVVAGRYTDLDTRGQAGDFVATINWGDGTAAQTTGITIARDATRPTLSGYQVSGSHTYARPGVYPVVVELTSTKGIRAFIHSTAIIADPAGLRAVGQQLEVRGPLVNNRILATFTDGTAPGRATDYLAWIDWGDGQTVPGRIVATGVGRFSVYGTKRYADPETFSASVRILKKTSAVETVAWSRVALSGFVAVQHLPPFAMSHLIAEMTPVQTQVGQAVVDKPVKTTKTVNPATNPPTTQTYLAYSVVILNSGNKPSPAAKLRFYLSADNHLDLNAQGQPVNGDARVTIGSFPEAFVGSLKPGSGVRYIFDEAMAEGDIRIRLPKNVVGTGMNLLAHLVYSDPIADHMPIERAAVEGKIDGFIIDDQTDDAANAAPFNRKLSTTESPGAGNTAVFRVKLDQAPAREIKVPVSVSDTSEGSVDKAELIFSPVAGTANSWNAWHTVTVTGKQDNVADGNGQYKVILGAAVTVQPGSPTPPVPADQFEGIDPLDIDVTNTDRDNAFTVSPASLTLTEAAGSEQSKTFSVKLNVAPGAGKVVRVPVTISNASEATISKTELLFTNDGVPSSENHWTRAHPVLVTAIDDAIDEGTQAVVTVTLGVASTVDNDGDPGTPGPTNPHLDGVNPADVPVTITDND